MCNGGHGPLRGKTLTVSHQQHKPFVMEDDGKGKFVGIAVHLMEVLSRKFDFQSQLRLENTFATHFPNGSIGGVIEKVVVYLLLGVLFLPVII